LVPASSKTSPSSTNPSSWAVAADIPICTVKLPAAGVPVSATGLAGLTTTGVTGVGVITGKSLATLTGLVSGVVTPGAEGMAPSAGGEASAGGVTVTVWAGVTEAGALLAGVLEGDLLGDGDGATTCTVPVAAGSAAMAGVVAAPAVAVRVTEEVPDGALTCACS
jgi:hypothetical protein